MNKTVCRNTLELKKWMKMESPCCGNEGFGIELWNFISISITYIVKILIHSVFCRILIKLFLFIKNIHINIFNLYIIICSVNSLLSKNVIILCANKIKATL